MNDLSSLKSIATAKPRTRAALSGRTVSVVGTVAAIVVVMVLWFSFLGWGLFSFALWFSGIVKAFFAG